MSDIDQELREQAALEAITLALCACQRANLRPEVSDLLLEAKDVALRTIYQRPRVVESPARRH